MSIFESIIYGLVSGFTEFLPVSSLGHQAMMLRLFGLSEREPLRDIIIHIAVLTALITSCKPLFSKLQRERMLLSRSKRKKHSERRGQYDFRLIKTTGMTLILGLMFYIATRQFETKPALLAAFFLLNGILLLIPEYIRHGNKDARFLTALDGVLLGILGAFSVLPGVSRIGMMSGYALARGADRQQSANWILALSAPALVLFVGFDIFHLFSIGVGIVNFTGFLLCLLSGIMAFLGGYFSIVLLRFLTVRTGFAGCAYYSCGAALFAFVLHLIA